MHNDPVTNIAETVVEVAKSESFQKRPWILATAVLAVFVLIIAYYAITQKNSGEDAYKQISENEAAENIALKKANELYNMQLNKTYDSIRQLNFDLAIFKMKDSIFREQTKATVKESYK